MISSTGDLADSKELERYNASIAQARSASKWLRRRLWILGALQIVGLTCSVSLSYAVFSDSEREAKSIHNVFYGSSHFGSYEMAECAEKTTASDLVLFRDTSTALLCGLSTWIVSALLLSFRLPAHKIRRARKLGKVVEPPPSLRRRVEAMLELTCESVRRLAPRNAALELLSARRIVPLIARLDGRCTPSIIGDQDQIILILPAGLLKLMGLRSNEQVVSAMIAHEVGHILHGDLSVWTSTTLAANLGLASIASALIVAIVNWSIYLHLYGIVFFFLLNLAWTIWRQALAVRQNSEVLADKCAILSGNGGGLAFAIEEFVVDGSLLLGRVHPRKEFRLKQIGHT